MLPESYITTMPKNYTLKQCSDLLQSKQASAVELAQEYLAAIESENTSLNAYITLDKERTIAEAKAADARLAQGSANVLTGVPTIRGSLIMFRVVPQVVQQQPWLRG